MSVSSMSSLLVFSSSAPFTVTVRHALFILTLGFHTQFYFNINSLSSYFYSYWNLHKSINIYRLHINTDMYKDRNIPTRKHLQRTTKASNDLNFFVLIQQFSLGVGDKINGGKRKKEKKKKKEGNTTGQVCGQGSQSNLRGIPPKWVLDIGFS